MTASSEPAQRTNDRAPVISVRDLNLAYPGKEVLHDLTFDICREDVFIIMGGSGCGKSTLLKAMIGLLEPVGGTVTIHGQSFWDAEPWEQNRIMRQSGVLYQQGALWSSLTLGENVALPLELSTTLSPGEIADIVSFKLALVGMAGYEGRYPAELSGGMKNRAGLARAMALDPDILFFDEPSAGLDPVTARRLDELILELRQGLATTTVVVTHDLDSIMTIGSQAVFLDAQARTMTASGAPTTLLEQSSDPKIIEFLTRGGRRGDPDLEGRVPVTGPGKPADRTMP